MDAEEGEGLDEPDESDPDEPVDEESPEEDVDEPEPFESLEPAPEVSAVSVFVGPAVLDVLRLSLR